MFHHVFGSQVASTLLSFCVEGTSFGTGLGPRNTGKQDRSDRMRSGAHAKATSNVSVASAASAAASQVADLIFMDHHESCHHVMSRCWFFILSFSRFECLLIVNLRCQGDAKKDDNYRDKAVGEHDRPFVL